MSSPGSVSPSKSIEACGVKTWWRCWTTGPTAIRSPWIFLGRASRPTTRSSNPSTGAFGMSA
ncbi:hypothetical protein TSO352_23000 [Azospirillum sp. TSO35-2]|nr:hypothetical protein TSO352_23000 [Azospirillum sp. TSO35-2]